MPLRPPDSIPPSVPGAPREVTSVRPVPRIAGAADSTSADLSRAGLDLFGLLAAGGDELVARTLPSAPALADLLERARASLVRGAAGESLAALDDAWTGAERTESGWYLRAAALALLGLPGEAERVLDQALRRRGASVALLFLRSVTRSAQGDSAGARTALSGALARRNGDTVLLAWQAVLTARSGDLRGARGLLASLLEATPGSSVLAWARQAITAAHAEAIREADPQAGDPRDALSAGAATPPADEPGPVLAPLTRAMHRLGARLADSSADDLQRDVRALLRAITAGGILDRSAQPSQVAAVRSVLTDLLQLLERTPGFGEDGVIRARASHATPVSVRGMPGLDAQVSEDGRWRVTPPLAHPPVDSRPGEVATAEGPTVDRPLGGNTSMGSASGNSGVPEPAATRARLLEALCAGRLDVAVRLLAKLGLSESDVAGAVLRTLVEGAHAESPHHDSAPAAAGLRTSDRRGDSLLVPVRIGLSLLQESSARAEARAALQHESVPVIAGELAGAAAFVAGALPLAPAHLGRHAGGISESTVSPRSMSGASPRGVAFVCMLLAFLALLNGYGPLAIALAGGASWLALRSSMTRRGHDAPQAQAGTGDPDPWLAGQPHEAAPAPDVAPSGEPLR